MSPTIPPDMESVILVDDADREVGTAPKLTAHESGTLHRAFSVFVFNARGELLLQRRATGKYHSGDLWTNTCCGHPRPGEPTGEAAARRLREEMGFACLLRHVATFTYRAELDHGLIEHEIDHVFVGQFDGVPMATASEVSAWRWVSRGALDHELSEAPGAFTAWFAPALDAVLDAVAWVDARQP